MNTLLARAGSGEIKAANILRFCLNGGRDVLIEGNLNMDVIVLDLRIVVLVVVRSSMVGFMHVRLGLLNFLRSLVLDRRLEPRGRNCRVFLRVLRELLLV